MISPELLRRYPYYADFNESSLKEVAMISDEVAAQGGKTLFSEGDSAEAMFILLEGEVDIRYTLGDGQQRTIDTVVAGDLLVWSTLVAPYRCTASGVTRKGCKLISINGSKLRALCQKDHDLGYRMLISVTQLLASRLEGARVQLAAA